MDQLLLLARYENQNQSIKIENVCLNAVLLDTISRFSSLIQSNNIQLITQFSNDIYVKSDRYLVTIIINNIISNAIKYSNFNGILTFAVTELDGKVVCTITDSGIGIPKEDLQKIFNPFFRSQSTDHPDIKGTGLGLSIVSRLCKLLDIDVAISSKENEGTQVELLFH